MQNISSKIKSGAGFTLAELAIILGVLATLIGLGTISLSNSQQKSSISATVNVIISDMRSQQIKAMIGDTEGRSTASAYGVHFDTDQYVLFNGAYSSSEPSNSVIDLPPSLEFTTSGVNIIFSQIDGELGSTASITIKSTANNEERTIELNQYGVVTGVN